MPFEYLKPGDTITRLISTAKVPMKMTVETVDLDNNIIHMVGGWDFEISNGVEFDEELGWGSKFGISGSYLVANDSP